MTVWTPETFSPNQPVADSPPPTVPRAAAMLAAGGWVYATVAYRRKQAAARPFNPPWLWALPEAMFSALCDPRAAAHPTGPCVVGGVPGTPHRVWTAVAHPAQVLAFVTRLGFVHYPPPPPRSDP